MYFKDGLKMTQVQRNMKIIRFLKTSVLLTSWYLEELVISPSPFLDLCNFSPTPHLTSVVRVYKAVACLVEVSLMMFFNRNRSQVFTSKCGLSAMSPSPRSSKASDRNWYLSTYLWLFLGRVYRMQISRRRTAEDDEGNI